MPEKPLLFADVLSCMTGLEGYFMYLNDLGKTPFDVPKVTRFELK